VYREIIPLRRSETGKVCSHVVNSINLDIITLGHCSSTTESLLSAEFGRHNQKPVTIESANNRGSVLPKYSVFGAIWIDRGYNRIPRKIESGLIETPLYISSHSLVVLVTY
jgi:hypothetical protein